MAGGDSPTALAAAEPAAVPLFATPRTSLEEQKKKEQRRSSDVERLWLLSAATEHLLPAAAAGGGPDVAAGEAAGAGATAGETKSETAAARAAPGRKRYLTAGAGDAGLQGGEGEETTAAAASRCAAQTAVSPCQQISVKWKDLTYDAHVPRPASGGAGTQFVATAVHILDRITGKGPLLRILYGSTGEVLPGDMLAMLGASGAGKSTLLGVLSRRLQTNGGEVFYGDEPATAETARQVTCFIQQEDFFNGFLTVREQLDSTMELRTSMGKAERSEKLKNLLAAFGLSKVADDCIGNLQMGARRGISGGEKKRLSIATGILSQPSIIFADEPTTGLDALTADSVMHVFRLLAQNGRSIICTIQQPSTRVFSMFNKVLLLTEGRQIFFGDRLALVPYLSRLGKPLPAYTNPADFVIDMLLRPEEDGKAAREDPRGAAQLLAKKLEQQWHTMGLPFMEEWRGGLRETYTRKLQANVLTRSVTALQQRTFSLHKGAELPAAAVPVAHAGGGKKQLRPLETESLHPPYRPSWWRQFRVLLRRSGWSNRRNPRVLQARLGQTLISSLLLGFIYLRLPKDVPVSRNGAANLININQGMTGIVSVLQTFTVDKAVALREYQGGAYSLVPYFLAKTTADFSFHIINPVLFTTIVWFMMGLNNDVLRWLWALAFVFVQTNVCFSLGYLISSLAPSLDVALACMPLLMMPLVLVSGFLIILDTLPRFWVWLPYLSPFRWTWSGLMHAMWEGVDLGPCPPQLQPPACYASGEEVLKYYCIDKDRMWLNFIILCIHFLAYRLLGLAALVFLGGKK